MTLLSRAQSRAIDQIAVEQYGVPSVLLMENAGRGAAEVLLERLGPGKVTVCCGKGNNGGDGYCLARHLMIAGVEVTLLALAPLESLTGDAATQANIARRLGLPIQVIPAGATEAEMTTALLGSAWIVDGLLGTGVAGAPRAPFDVAIRAINTAGAGSGVRVLALDVPSGLDADSGSPFRDETGHYTPCVRADVTTTFVGRKIGFDKPSSREFTGDVVIVGIGVPDEVVARAIGQ